MCDIFLKRDNDFLYKKNEYLSGSTFKEIEEHLEAIQKQKYSGDSYYELLEVKENKGKLIYKFKSIPARDSIARRNNFPERCVYYKIAPRLNLEDSL